MGTYRIAKTFEVESGHRLSRHPEKCRFPHGHTRRIEIVLRADRLDDACMVCDYKVLKEVARREVERLDHAMVLAADDPLAQSLAPFAERLLLLPDGDPTTEVLAKFLFERLAAAFRGGEEIMSEGGVRYRVPGGVCLERVRVWETSSTWAEYSENDG